jgi:hypothetical protein
MLENIRATSPTPAIDKREFLDRLKVIKSDILRIDNVPPTTTDAGDLAFIAFARQSWCLPSADWDSNYGGRKDLQLTINNNPALFFSRLVKVAYDCSSRADFGLGRRGVPKVIVEVHSEIPGNNN